MGINSKTTIKHIKILYNVPMNIEGYEYIKETETKKL